MAPRQLSRDLRRRMRHGPFVQPVLSAPCRVFVNEICRQKKDYPSPRMRQRTKPVAKQQQPGRERGVPPCASGGIAGELECGHRWPACVDAPPRAALHGTGQ
ncbi:hypothetical protein MTO96_025322 [Rhipicephalus appendiculatus]